MRRGSFAASPKQREAVKDQSCVWCGRPGCDPAHLIPRSLGGCDERLCVIPLCRLCHGRYDQGNLNLLEVVKQDWREQYKHAIGHVGRQAAHWRISNERPKQGRKR